MTEKYRRRLYIMIGCTIVTFCLHRYEPDIMQSLIDSAGIVGIALLVLDKED
jgi:hypothetical protein